MTDETTTSDNTDTDEATGRARSRTRTRRRSSGDDSGSRDTTSSRRRADDGNGDGRDSRGGGKASDKGSDTASGKGSDKASDTASGKDAKASDKGGDSDDGGGSSRKRRSRRGRRGRGRSSKSSSGGKSSADTTSSGSKDTSGDGGSSKDSDSDSIRPGGTRLAAKRGRRSGGGGGGGGRSGGGGRRGKVQGVPEDVRRAMLDGPPKTMLVSVSDDRTQIAILEDRTLFEHNVTRKSDVTLVGNIYMARVQNVLPGMEAAFLDIGKGRNGVLYAGEVLYDDLDVEEGDTPRIEDALQSGQKVLVQVTKDAMGTKGPRLTMQLSLAGRYTVLAPNSDVFGISRKLTDKERDRLRKVVKKVKPAEHGVIVRTAAEDIPEDQLTADLERLLRKWERVEAAASDAKALTCVYEEPPLHVKVIRDTFGPDFDKCIIDDLAVHDAVTEYLGEVAPDLAANVELYGPARYERDERDRAKVAEPAAPEEDAETTPEATTDDDVPAAETEAAEPAAPAETPKSRFAPLFDAYNVTEQLRKAMGRKVWLPSGGYLIIEATEAMKVIDVNTGKYTGNGKQNLEEVVLKTNLEAAEEIVRQLRLRDIGGIIIIDFIDMLLKANQEQVVRKLKRELLRDRTKTRVSDVSRLGLVQMTRKNVSAGLVESFSHKCEHCEGRGFVNEFD